MQHLTEQQIAAREDAFFNLIDHLVTENYEVADDYEASEEDLYIASLLMEYFIENYKSITIDESLDYVFNDIDPNSELYLEIEDAILDEAIGKYVAGAVHGLRTMAAKVGKKFAQRKASKAKMAASMAKQKATAASKAAKETEKTAKGITGTVKTSFAKARAEKLTQKASAASLKASQAATEREAAASRAKSAQAKQRGLATRIDTGISNIKKRVTGAIKAGAARVGAAAGRLAA